MTKEQEIILKINEMNFLLTGEAKEKYSPVLQEVLSMLNEKDEKIEKKDKQIDLMAEEIEKRDIEFTEYCEFKIVCDRNCKHCIEQYFKRRANQC